MLTPEQINNLPPDTRKEYLKTALLLDEKKKEKDIRAVSYTHLTLPTIMPV